MFPGFLIELRRVRDRMKCVLALKESLYLGQRASSLLPGASKNAQCSTGMHVRRPAVDFGKVAGSRGASLSQET